MIKASKEKPYLLLQANLAHIHFRSNVFSLRACMKHFLWSRVETLLSSDQLLLKIINVNKRLSEQTCQLT